MTKKKDLGRAEELIQINEAAFDVKSIVRARHYNMSISSLLEMCKNSEERIQMVLRHINFTPESEESIRLSLFEIKFIQNELLDIPNVKTIEHAPEVFAVFQTAKALQSRVYA